MSLAAYILRKIASSAVAVLGVLVLVFLFLHIVPGDPVDNLAGGDATPEMRHDLAECMHLDRPMYVQFGLFLKSVGNGTLGQQCPNPKDKPPVSARIAEAMPYTFELALGGMVVAILLSLPLGVAAAVRRGTWADAAATTVSLAGISIPIMWMGPALLSLFYLNLGWLPGPGGEDERLALLLPSVVLGTHLMAMLSRLTRSSLLDVLREDYMQTARAKGLAPAVVILKHGLRNALLPVITIAGLQFGSLLAGAIITEKVFSRPGLGSLIVDAIRQRNYPMIQGCVFVIAVITVTMNVLVDVAYGVADPRIRRTR